MVTSIQACWCGNNAFRPFGPDYGECKNCGTLVYLKQIPHEHSFVKDDDTDFYGKSYWLERQQDQFGTADIYSRARQDLTERNLHWLNTLLKYRLPTAKVVELGCSHGSFVALMRQAGYDASGVEMSPWVVEFGKKTFGIPVSVGPIENLDMPSASVDIIVAMDVLEHLADPVATMARCMELLKPDGLLLIQTPQFKENMEYGELVESSARFLEMLIPQEHIYLFSENSVTRLFERLGAKHIAFERAIFDHYDMFFAVSRVPFQTNSSEQVDSALQTSPHGRLTTALLDLRKRELAANADRIARGEQIETLTRSVHESEADRVARGEQIETLTRLVHESEADRAARGNQIKLLRDVVRRAHEKNSSREALLKVQKSELANQEKQISSLLNDVKGLFRHPAFRWIAKLGRWSEAEKLEKRIDEP
ncbi:methyltransferase domain-containing protein [Paraburkholderia saeva]|uniref:Ubiquinone biosynthesis O-methyltransferase, mitochondrial n=1 Tax=Paraburkholderia saeva TaxID=2777537 RepID=A0A9N8WZA2_9BURK|nr:methyltransferase domain-containing protein [Paraburkholderia saeva]CAG4887791.1 Ubiquinone biosynthesis O-methyltransferase, mitochondrial [Paraburkholderia saeva]